MENNELDKIINDFLIYCEKNNYRGVIAAADKNYEKNFFGNFADNFDVTFLMRNFLRHFQEKKETPAIFLATHLALSIAIMDINDASEKPLEKVDAKILEQAIAIVQDCMEKELEQTRLMDAKG